MAWEEADLIFLATITSVSVNDDISPLKGTQRVVLAPFNPLDQERPGRSVFFSGVCRHEQLRSEPNYDAIAGKVGDEFLVYGVTGSCRRRQF